MRYRLFFNVEELRLGTLGRSFPWAPSEACKCLNSILGNSRDTNNYFSASVNDKHIFIDLAGPSIMKFFSWFVFEPGTAIFQFSNQNKIETHMDKISALPLAEIGMFPLISHTGNFKLIVGISPKAKTRTTALIMKLSENDQIPA